MVKPLRKDLLLQRDIMERVKEVTRQIIAEKKNGVSGEDVNKALQELGLDNTGLSSGLTGSSNLIDVNTLAPDIPIRSIDGEADLDQLKQQAIGIPMGTNWSPILANLLLFSTNWSGL